MDEEKKNALKLLKDMDLIIEEIESDENEPISNKIGCIYND